MVGLQVFWFSLLMPAGVEFGALPLVSTFTQVKPCLFSNPLRKALRKPLMRVPWMPKDIECRYE
jgi:hypothetical protein